MFGFAYGGAMPLYAIIVRDYFGERIMGAVFGAVSMRVDPGHGARTVRRAAGCTMPSAATSGCSSAHSGIGLGAVAIAVTFRPPAPDAGRAADAASAAH